MSAFVAVALAIVSLVFLLQVTAHSHASGHDEADCRLCQVAHIGIAPALSATLLSLVLLYFGEIRVPVSQHITESFSAHSASRAPPSQVA
jgi:hypothetical protein